MQRESYMRRLCNMSARSVRSRIAVGNAITCATLLACWGSAPKPRSTSHLAVSPEEDQCKRRVMSMHNPTHQSDHHNGVDFVVCQGESVVAVADGHVAYVFVADYDLDKGSTVIIRHPYSTVNGYVLVMYAHLGEILVHEGEEIRRGHRLGTAWRPSERQRSYGFQWTEHVHLQLVTETARGTFDPLDLVRGCLSESQIGEQDFVYPVSC
jgi:hypothetical protein